MSNNPSLAMQRISKLVDENSFMEIGSLVTARSTDFNLSSAFHYLHKLKINQFVKILYNAIADND